MRIVFLKAFGPWAVGAEIDHPHDGVADTLVRRGIARLAGQPEKPARKLVVKSRPKKKG